LPVPVVDTLVPNSEYRPVFGFYGREFGCPVWGLGTILSH